MVFGTDSKSTSGGTNRTICMLMESTVDRPAAVIHRSRNTKFLPTTIEVYPSLARASDIGANCGWCFGCWSVSDTRCSGDTLALDGRAEYSAYVYSIYYSI